MNEKSNDPLVVWLTKLSSGLKNASARCPGCYTPNCNEGDFVCGDPARREEITVRIRYPAVTDLLFDDTPPAPPSIPGMSPWRADKHKIL